MKKYIFCLVFIGSALLVSSCTDYLDKAPDAGITESDVFEKYRNSKAYFDVVYFGKDGRNIRTSYPLTWMFWDQKTGFDAMTEIADNGRLFFSQSVKQGQMGNLIGTMCYDKVRRPVLDAMFKSIRISNTTIRNAHRIADATRQEDVDDLIGQAYFVRGYAHFVLSNFWGPMPHIDYPLNNREDWDLPRLSKNESYRAVAADMDSAFVFFEKAGKIRRDAGPGKPGHLQATDQARPGGVAAKALKARALLYAASPLNNEKGSADWQEAAAASWEALKIALDQEYSLQTLQKYSDNNYGVRYTNEHIWAANYGILRYNSTQLQSILSGIFSNNKNYASGEMPTQNMVDRYETKWGDPLNTEADREAAINLGHYKEQDPYKDRDPRFYNNVIFNQAKIQWNNVKSGEKKHIANIYYTLNAQNKKQYATHLDQSFRGRSYTGYYVRKYVGDLSHQNRQNLQVTDPLIRLAELYLNYAEAVNEAYGPTGMAPGANISAQDALNRIRKRVEMPELRTEYTANQDVFREKLKNERTVELSSEGFHHYHDIRRWKDAPKLMTQVLYGMDIEKVAMSEEYPLGFKYTRKALPSNRQGKWFDYMYYLPFIESDYYKMNVFDAELNPRW